VKYETTITSKGTITIASPIRKALGLKTGQKVRLFINENKNVEVDTGIAVEEFERLRDQILRNIQIPDRLKGKTVNELRIMAADLWKNEFYKPRRKRRTPIRP
jgi:AbrB family looped-hinge helix DNA binding protein